MRRVLAASVIITLALTFAPVSLAATASSSAEAAMPLRGAADQKLTATKEKSDKEITRRITSLNNLLTRFNDLKKLPTDDKSKFAAQIQDYISQLTTLKDKIDADTDLQTLRTDAKSIFTTFRVYAVFMPKLAELSALNRMGLSADSLTDIAGKLQTKVAELQGQGKDVTSLQSLLTDMNSQITDAKTVYQAVEAEITPLAPDGYPANITTLKDGRSKIKTGAADLRAAWNDAVQIRQALKSGGSATNSATMSAPPSATNSAFSR
jgi:chromosome segregation ATPase